MLTTSISESGVGYVNLFNGELTYINNLTTIENQAFFMCEKLEEVYIPETVTLIHKFAFDWCPKFTIHAPAGSYAETYAKENNIPFVAE